MMKAINWFDDGRFGRVHHRFLNDLRSLNALSAQLDTENSAFVEIVEGDLCWHRDGNGFRFFMMHPASGNRIPEAKEIFQRIDRRELHTLDAILSPEYAHLKFVIELKAGTGNWRAALRKAIETLEEKASGRYILDAFFPTMLREVKAISPHTPTSLHTRLGLLGSRVIVTHFEPTFVSLPCVADLSFIDILTITYKYCLPRNLGVDLNQYLRPPLSCGKTIFFGGVNSEQEFDLIRATKGTSAAYAKFLKGSYAMPLL